MRTLGFCVNIAHARFMARVFNEANIPSVAVWSDTPDDERRAALTDLAARSEEPIEMGATKQSRGVPGCSPSGTPAKALIYALSRRRTPHDEENRIPTASCWEGEDAATGWTLHQAHRLPSMPG